MTNPARPILLDLSDLFFQIGRGPITGIGRVSMSYLEHCLDLPRDVMGLIHHRRGVFLLDRASMAWFAAQLRADGPWGAPDLRARLRTDMPPAQRAALSAVRAQALDHAPPFAMRRLLRRRVPAGAAVVLTGLGNLHRGPMADFVAAGLAPVPLIHDTIPLDFPDYVPKGGYDWFERRLRAVGALAEMVLYNSAATRADAEAHLARLGRVPPAVVAHLGLTPLVPDPGLVPETLVVRPPYFVVLGTVEPRKNHALLLDLWDRMAQQTDQPLPRLLILGSRGWRNDAVFCRLDASPLRGVSVIEVAGLEDGAVAALLQGAAALLLPSFAEGFGLPAIEAAAFGTPVICNDLPVYREILGDYPEAIPVSDPARWQATIRTWAEGPVTRRPVPALPGWTAHFDTVFAALDRGAAAPRDRADATG